MRWKTTNLHLQKWTGKEHTMSWKTTTLHLMKGNVLAVYRDSALFFR